MNIIALSRKERTIFSIQLADGKTFRITYRRAAPKNSYIIEDRGPLGITVAVDPRLVDAPVTLKLYGQTETFGCGVSVAADTDKFSLRLGKLRFDQRVLAPC